MNELPNEWADLDDKTICSKLSDLDKNFKQLKEKGIDEKTTKVFEILSKGKFRELIAKNKSTPNFILLNIINQLTSNGAKEPKESFDQHIRNCAVRNLFGINPSFGRDPSGKEECSIEMLEKLSNHGDSFIRYNVASSGNVTKEILEKLLNDKDDYVKGAASENLLPIEWKNMTSNYEFEKIRTILKSEEVDQNIYELLSLSNSFEVREILIANPSTPEEIIEELKKVITGFNIKSDYDQENINKLKSALVERSLPKEWATLNISQKKKKIESEPLDIKILETIFFLSKIDSKSNPKKLIKLKEAILKNPNVSEELTKQIKESLNPIISLTREQKYTLCNAMAVAGFAEETSGAFSNAFNWLDIEEPEEFNYVDGKDNEIYQEIESNVIQTMFLKLFIYAQYQPESFNEFCEGSKPWSWTLEQLSNEISKINQINDEFLETIVKNLEDWD